MYVWFAAFWSLKLGLHFKSAHRPEPTNAATSAFASSSIGSRASGFCARGAERTTRAVTWREACGNLSTCGGSAPGGSTSVTGERGAEAGAYAAAAAARAAAQCSGCVGSSGQKASGSPPPSAGVSRAAVSSARGTGDASNAVSVTESTRSGWRSASSSATRPPIEQPTRCTAGRCSLSSSVMVSSASTPTLRPSLSAASPAEPGCQRHHTLR